MDDLIQQTVVMPESLSTRFDRLAIEVSGHTEEVTPS